MKKQKGFVLWFTDLPGAGKTTLADAVYDKLNKEGYQIEKLDGDLVRHELAKELGFSRKHRAENIKRAAFVASLLSKHDIGVIASFVSPYKSEREYVRNKVNNYIEVYVNTPLETYKQRHAKKACVKNQRREIELFTTISDPYEEPENPHIKICGDEEERIEELVEEIFNYLTEQNFI